MDANQYGIFDLLSRRKYQNPRNLLRTRLATEAIASVDEASIAFLVTQHRINRIILNQLMDQYVYDVDEPLSNKCQQLLMTRGDILSKWQVRKQMLVFPLDTLANRLRTFIKTCSHGYSTYGDYEDNFAIYISILMDFGQFLNFIRMIKDDLENIDKRNGLLNHLQSKLAHHYRELQSIIDKNATTSVKYRRLRGRR